MTRKRELSVAVLCVLLLTTVLVTTVPTARAAIGPKTITVDGNPSDWTGVVPAANAGAEDAGAAEFVWNDTTGDDTGDADYTYPKSPDLNRTGLFDLTQVRFAADATNLYVLIQVQNLSNTWGGSDGFSTVAAVLLIDTTRDASGQLSARPNVAVAAGNGWEYWVKIAQTGWHAEDAKIFDASGHWAATLNRANPAFNSIEVSIPLAFIGKDGTAINGDTWRFSLLLGSFDGGGPNGFRDAHAARWGEDWVFGGGADHGFDPQVIDIAFSATQAGQEAELGSFTSTSPATITSSVDVSFGNLGFVPDTTPAVISGTTVTATFNSARVDWTTNEASSTVVLWGTAPGQLTNPPASKDEFVTSHSATLASLQPTTTYYYRVASVDIAGNWATSPESSFTTPAAPPSNLAAWDGSNFTWLDKTGDDVGDGDYTYPQTGLVDWFGRADLKWVNISRSSTALHFHLELNANPEGEWRQRMGTVAVFIDQDHVYGSGARWVGLVGTGAELTDPHPMNLSVAPDFAWEYMVVANFQNRSAIGDATGVGEMLVFRSTWVPAQRRYELIYQSNAPSLSPEPDTGQIYAQNGTQADIWLNYSVLGAGDNWTYAIASMIYDDAARPFETGGIRQVRPAAGDWVGGGSNGPFNPNVYDLAFYPDTASQATDLSGYTSTSYANVSRAIQLDLTNQWYTMIHIQNLLAMSSSLSVAEVGPGATSSLTAFVTNRNAPVAGASVAMTANPASAVDITTANPATTNDFGAAMFTVRGRVVAADTTVTLTATGTVGGGDVTSTASLVVKGLTHTYHVAVAAADGVLATGAQTDVSATFTDKGAPIAGATVALQSNSAAVIVVAPSATTNAQGVATFTVRSGYVEVNTDVTLTATATNASVPTSGALGIRVLGFAHAYSLSGSASASVVGANNTTTVTFTFLDAGVPRAGTSVALTLSSGAPFDIVGNAAATTNSAGTVSFTLRARPIASDAAAIVTATATNGTTQTTATVTVVAQGLPPAAGPTVTQVAGIASEVFTAVVVILVIVAAALGALWIRSRGGSRPPEEGAEGE